MPRTPRTWPAILFAFVLLAGCASMKVNVNYDDTVDFSPYKTFAFSEDANEIRGTTARAGAVARLIERTVRDELVRKSFTAADLNPDFVVAYHASVIDVNANMPYSGGRYSAWGQGASHIEFLSEGTLILDIIDAASNELVWRGEVTTAVERGSSEGADKLIQTLVAKMLDKFPPR